MASPDVIWQVIRSGSSYVIKRDGQTFTTEPQNLTAQHTFAHSGLAQRKVVGVEPTEEGDVILTTKSKKGTRKPVKSVVSVTLAGKRRGARKVAKAVSHVVGGRRYRKDLRRVAVARATRLAMAAKKQES